MHSTYISDNKKSYPLGMICVYACYS